MEKDFNREEQWKWGHGKPKNILKILSELKKTDVFKYKKVTNNDTKSLAHYSVLS